MGQKDKKGGSQGIDGDWLRALPTTKHEQVLDLLKNLHEVITKMAGPRPKKRVLVLFALCVTLPGGLFPPIVATSSRRRPVSPRRPSSAEADSEVIGLEVFKSVFMATPRSSRPIRTALSFFRTQVDSSWKVDVWQMT